MYVRWCRAMGGGGEQQVGKEMTGEDGLGVIKNK